MNRKKRENENRILREMLSDGDGTAKSDNDATLEKSVAKKSGDVIRCPKCGYILESRSSCPRCGYNGYVPMTESETKKTKLILYPIAIILLIIYILWQKGVFG